MLAVAINYWNLPSNHDFKKHLLDSPSLCMCICELISVWMFQQGAQTLFSMEKLKNVTFEEEYIKLFPPQPNQPFVWLCSVFSPCCLKPPQLAILLRLHLLKGALHHQIVLEVSVFVMQQ